MPYRKKFSDNFCDKDMFLPGLGELYVLDTLYVHCIRIAGGRQALENG